MRVIGLRIVLQAVLAVTVCAAVARAEDKDASKRPPYSKQDLERQIEYCQTCHGASGEGVPGTRPIPRLAPVTTATRPDNADIFPSIRVAPSGAR